MEAERALALGADELDMVINIGALKDKKDDIVFKDINQIANLTKRKGKTLKVIIETTVLTEEVKERAAK
jgi:deoxyribose-phosphate aldolase